LENAEQFLNFTVAGQSVHIDCEAKGLTSSATGVTNSGGSILCGNGGDGLGVLSGGDGKDKTKKKQGCSETSKFWYFILRKR
jgi:hypothetical protein